MSVNKKGKRAGVTFLKVFNGSVVQEWKSEPTADQLVGGAELEDVKMRENKNGEPVWYIEFDSVSGNLTNAEIKHVEKLKSDFLEITLVDVIDKFVLSVPVNSGYANTFLYKMFNLDVTKEIELEPYSFTKNDKKYVGFTIYQGEDKIPKFYTKENPQGLPRATKKRVGREEKWDFTEVQNFLYDEFDRFLKVSKFEELSKAEPSPPEPVVTEAQDEEYDNGEDMPEPDFDDLPF